MAQVSTERAILFADVSGSTRLYELLGDKVAKDAIARCLAVLTAVVEAQRGRVVKTIGDEIMAVFPRPEAAAAAAHQMQNNVAAMPPVSGQPMRIRVGFHFGPVLEDDNDFFGDGVNVAARLAGLAKAGQVLTSGETAAAMTPWQRRDLRSLADINVKGKQVALDLYELMWEDTDDATHIVGARTVSRPVQPLKIDFKGRAIEFPAALTVIAIGRDPASEVVLSGKNASRRHARIERRRDQYFLIDESSNGTFVTFDGDAELLLRREQVLLRGRGLVSFGAAAADPDAETLRFSAG